ncbi:hypothetical protein Avbf_05514 [Armadillidium vulgare]|nr:hypothetical protein Avbf_05514 [Armadillidium vulgare]
MRNQIGLVYLLGKVIHSVGDYQDARKIGGEIFNLPITRAIIVLSRYALCGLSSSYSFRLLFLSIIRFTNQNVSLIRDEED